MVDIRKVTNKEQIQTINRLAWEILIPFYAPYIPDDHTRFFLNKFQSTEAIEAQLATDFTYFLLHYHNSAVGYLGIQSLETELHLSKLYILERYRGKGVGSKAMVVVEESALLENYKTIGLFVNKNNHDTIRFYEKYGFHITALVNHSFENGHSVEDYKMEKSL